MHSCMFACKYMHQYSFFTVRYMHIQSLPFQAMVISRHHSCKGLSSTVSLTFWHFWFASYI